MERGSPVLLCREFMTADLLECPSTGVCFYWSVFLLECLADEREEPAC